MQIFESKAVTHLEINYVKVEHDGGGVVLMK